MKQLLYVVALILLVSPLAANKHRSFLREISRGVVLIHNAEGNAGATGFLITGKSGKKYIMTNGHVCKLERQGPISVFYQGQDYPSHVIKQYQFNDLCVMSAPENAGFTAPIAYSLTIGEQAFAIGHPLLQPKSITAGELSGIVTLSLMTGLDEKPGDCDGPTYERVPLSEMTQFFYQATEGCVRTLRAQSGTMPILPGNSGSPVVNIYGSVIGVAFASENTGVRSYVVPLEDLKDFLAGL